MRALVAAGGVAIVLGLAVVSVSTPLQVLLQLLSVAVAPTIAIAGLLRGLDKVARFLVAATATLIINSFVAEITLSAGAWSPRLQLIAIVLITAAVTVVQLRPAIGALMARLSARRAAKPHGATQAGHAGGSGSVVDALGAPTAEPACAFADIWAAFAELKQSLGLPTQDGYPGTDPCPLHPAHPRSTAPIGPMDNRPGQRPLPAYAGRMALGMIIIVVSSLGLVAYQTSRPAAVQLPRQLIDTHQPAIILPTVATPGSVPTSAGGPGGTTAPAPGLSAPLVTASTSSGPPPAAAAPAPRSTESSRSTRTLAASGPATLPASTPSVSRSTAPEPVRTASAKRSPKQPRSPLRPPSPTPSSRSPKSAGGNAGGNPGENPGGNIAASVTRILNMALVVTYGFAAVAIAIVTAMIFRAGRKQ